MLMQNHTNQKKMVCDVYTNDNWQEGVSFGLTNLQHLVLYGMRHLV